MGWETEVDGGGGGAGEDFDEDDVEGRVIERNRLKKPPFGDVEGCTGEVAIAFLKCVRTVEYLKTNGWEQKR